MDGSFIELEAETIERHVNESWNIMYKMEKAFDLQELPVCAGNCKSLKGDIDKFKAPVITVSSASAGPRSPRGSGRRSGWFDGDFISRRAAWGGCPGPGVRSWA